MDDGRPVFTDCRAANAPGSKSLEYEARWERYGYKALAYVWIEDGRLTRVERHFDPHGSPFPFDVSLDVFTDDVSLREPIGEQPEPLDDSCFDVNAAFRRTVDTPRVMKSTWGQNPVREQVMVLDNALYLKKNGSWRRHDLPLQALTTPQGAMFHLCVRQAANEKEVYYSAWLLEAGTSIPIDMWVSVETGKFTRTSRNYSPTGQMYHTRTVEQVFDYNPSGATMPQQYSPDIPLPDIWAADSDLR